MKSNKKLVCKVRRFFAMCVAGAILMGTIYIHELQINAATPNTIPSTEPTDFYRIQWPVDNPQGYCNIHFVDETGRTLDPGDNYIDIGEDEEDHNLKNVKCIWGSDDEQVHKIAEDNLSVPPSVHTGWYLSLLDLVSPPQPEVEAPEDSDAFEEYQKEIDLYNKFHNEIFDNYEFVRAYVGDENGNFNTDKAYVINPYLYGINVDDDEEGKIINMRYYKEYCPDFDGEGLDDDEYGVPADGKDIYLVFKRKSSPTQVKDTISNAEIGLEVYLFDYDGRKWGEHNYTGSNPDTGLYSTVLGESGFPVFNDGNSETNMSQYFNPSEENDYYVGTADNLFQYDPDRGIYYYNSAWNAAYYNKEDGKFVLYDEVVCPEDYTHTGWFFRRGAFQRGNFLPFNDIDKDKVWAYNIDNDKGQRATPVYGLQDYDQEGNITDAADYYFGMYMNGKIYQPNGGMVTNTDGNKIPMIFNITGDDDILVYIDDVLVLDLGGIHDPLEGKIDFSTGNVTVKGESETSKTLKEIFQEASGEDFDNTYGKLFKADSNTFADNSLHTIKVFYAERGAGASNLWVELNAPTPTITIKNSFWLDENGSYSPLDIGNINDNIKNAKYILKKIGVDEQGKEKIEVVDTISYKDFTNGTYVFKGLDYMSSYVVEQKLSDEGDSFDGSTNEYQYKFTYLDKPDNKISETKPIDLTKDGFVFNPTIEFNNVYEQEKTGSIVIDNSFILSKLDGTTEPMDSAPNKAEFENIVFIVKDEDGNTVETVKYNQFVNGKYTVRNLDESKMYTIEIIGISLNSGNGGTEEHSYVNTTIGGTKSYLIKNIVPSVNGTNVQVVNIYDEHEDNINGKDLTLSNGEIPDTGDNQSILPMTVLLLLAFCGVVVCTITKRKQAN